MTASIYARRYRGIKYYVQQHRTTYRWYLKLRYEKNVKIHDLFMYLLSLYFIQNPGLVNELWVNGWDEASIREI